MEARTAPFAKITQPKFSGVFQRKRLFTLLDRSRRQPVVWIAGPPGAGKTILISSYLEARALPCIWYQIDSGDEDIATFFYYMGIAAKKVSPRRRPLPLFTQEYIPGAATFTQRYFEDFFQRLKIPSVIVFDNFHECHAGSLFHEIMRTGFRNIREGINIIVISRSNPSSDYARFKADNYISLITYDNLRLSAEESSGIIKARFKGRFDRKDLQEAHKRTNGWIAGLVLMFERIKKDRADYKKIQTGDTEAIFEYFNSEILAKADEEIRGFLLKTSILPAMDSKIVEQLTGIKDSARILSNLSHNNCFTEKHLHSNPVYQYHPLFREFLLIKAKKSFAADELAMIMKNAASILYGSGRLEDAFELFRDSSEWKGIINLVMGNAGMLIKQGRGRVVEEWITSLPESVLNSQPWLLYWLGISCMAVNLKESCVYLEKAFNLFKEQKDSAGVYLSWSGIVNSLTLALEDLKPLDIYIPMLNELMHSFGGFPSEEIEARAASSMFMALVYRQPQHPEIDSWGEKAIALSQKCKDMGLAGLAMSNYIFNKIRAGELDNAFIVIESYRRLAKPKDAPPILALMTKWIETIYFKVIASHERCLKSVFEGLKLSASTGVHIMDFLLMGHGTLSALSFNDLKTAEEFLKKMAASPNMKRPCDQGFYHLLSAYYCLIKKDFKHAAGHAEPALKFAQEIGFPVAESICHLANSHAAHELKEHDKSLYHLNEGLRISRQIKDKHMEFVGLFAEAQFAFDNSNEEAGLASLRNAFSIAKGLGYVNIYLMRQDDIARLCCKALQAGIEVEYVQDMIKKRGLVPHHMPDDIENWPWAVKVFTLGRFGIVKDGKGVVFPKKAQQRPLSLLKSLIASGSRDIREEDLTAILWPEAEGDSSHKAFAVNLHRLRSLIGERAVRFRDGKITLNDNCCWVDTWAFERLLSRADAALKKGNKDEAICLIEKAVLLYQGQFLGHDGAAPWIVPFRERLSSKFLRYINMLNRLYEEMGDFDNAIDALRKGIEISPLSEGFYQSLMTCYIRLGRNAEALAVYDSLKKTLSAALNIKPSQSTENISQSIYNSISQAR